MLTLPILAPPRFSEANSSIIGAILRHGPHQGAQKSTSTGSALLSTSFWKLVSVISSTFAAAMFILRLASSWAGIRLAGNYSAAADRFVIVKTGQRGRQ